jgi:leucine dehydrogenase
LPTIIDNKLNILMTTDIINLNELHKVDPVFGQISFDGHEQVVFCNDKDTGLKAIIGIHNTVLGPALGGTRMWKYANEWEALNDVLRLSRGMSFKSSISGLNLGGGKAVIIGDAKTEKTPELMRKFGE